MDEKNEIITRSKKKIMRSLGIIKKAKINNFSSIKKNMGKKPSNKDKDNEIIINLDINEISTILNQKSPRKNKIVTKKKSSNPKTIVSSLPKKLKVVSNEEKKEMIKKYGGYYDENDNFIIDYNSDIESDKDLENNIIKKDYLEKFTEE